VADDVGQAHDGPNRQRGLGSLGRVADEFSMFEKPWKDRDREAEILVAPLDPVN
jgi:hypothetical protein